MTRACWLRGRGEGVGRIRGFSHTKMKSVKQVALNLMKFTASDAVFGNVLVCGKRRNKMALF